MAKELPTLNSSDKELAALYETHSKIFFHWSESNEITPRNSRDLAFLAQNEMVKRSNNRFSKKAVKLTYAVIFLWVITISFAIMEFIGDKQWHREHIIELESLNKNLFQKNSEIESLKIQLETANKRLRILEENNKTESK